MLLRNRSRPRRAKPSKSKPELPLELWPLKLRDYVEIIKGPEKGARGQVLSRNWKENTVTVDGVKVAISDKLDPESRSVLNPEIITIRTPLPFHFSYAAVIDPATDEPTDVRFEVLDGKLRRISVASGHGVCTWLGGAHLWLRTVFTPPAHHISHLRDVLLAEIPSPPPPPRPPAIPQQYAENLVTRREDVLAVTYVPFVRAIATTAVIACVPAKYRLRPTLSAPFLQHHGRTGAGADPIGTGDAEQQLGGDEGVATLNGAGRPG